MPLLAKNIRLLDKMEVAKGGGIQGGAHFGGPTGNGLLYDSRVSDGRISW